MNKLEQWADEILSKGGGPYIGPRGGKWADPGHKIPWKDRKNLQALGPRFDPRLNSMSRASIADAEDVMKRLKASDPDGDDWTVDDQIDTIYDAIEDLKRTQAHKNTTAEDVINAINNLNDEVDAARDSLG